MSENTKNNMPQNDDELNTDVNVENTDNTDNSDNSDVVAAVSSDSADTKKKSKKKSKDTTLQKRPNAFVRFGRWIKNVFRTYISELKKVTWTSKDELKKSTLLVVLTVAVFGIMIGIIDVTCYYIIDFIAKLI